MSKTSHAKPPWHTQIHAIKTLQHRMTQYHGLPLSAALSDLPADTLVNIEFQDPNQSYTQPTSERHIHSQYIENQPNDIRFSRVMTVSLEFDHTGPDTTRPVCILTIPTEPA